MILKKHLKIIALILSVQLCIACQKSESDSITPPSNHKCYLTEIGYIPPDWSEYYSFNENSNLTSHTSRTRYYCNADFIYNANQQVIQSKNLWADGYSIIDSITYNYTADTLIKKTIKHFGSSLIYTKVESYNYELGGDRIKTTKMYNGQVAGYQERLYDNNKLVKFIEFDINHAEIEKYEIEHDTILHLINILKNGQQYRLIYFDFKNCPEKALNIYNLKNIRIGMDYQPFIFFHEYSFLKGFLLSYQNPIKVIEENNTTIYSYNYNEFDYPIKRKADKPLPKSDTNYELNYSYNCNN